MLQVHARNSEFNLNLIDSGNCNRGFAIRTSNGHDMLHAFERVVSDVLLIGRTSFQNEIYSHAKRVRKPRDLIVEFDIEKNLKKNLSASVSFR